jgi:cellulose synthase/poly-beta-1,6-N-acetylglucosamine synthase-like glycosyltransferase
MSTSSEEVPLNWNKWVRQTHRWLSIAFTATVIANFVALARGNPPAWVTYSPLPPLALLLFTGLYLFALPYLTKWRSARPAR